MIRLIAITCLAMSVGCATRSTAPLQDATLIGMNVSSAIRIAGLAPERRFAIDEPAGIPRGIKTHDRRGDIVELYVKRGDLPFSRNMDWSLEQFQTKAVIGVARQHDGNWSVVGQVMLIRQMEATRLPTKPSEQAVPSDGHKPSSSISTTCSTSPADAH